MRILLVGAGGVGTAFARIAARRAFAELVIADYDLGRAQRAAAARDGYLAVPLDARDEQAAAGLLRQHRCDVLMNATDPRFVMPLFRAALAAGTHYLDMAMSLSQPHPDDPYRQVGVKLGDEQFAMAPRWEQSGKLALAGIGVEPGLSDVFARYAADELFGEIAELGVRDGANLEVAGYDFAPTFSIWTTIEECLNPPVVWERGAGALPTEPFSEPETFTFPAGIGPVECVNVEHEEVLLMPRWIEARRVTFKYGLGEEFIGVLRTLHKLGLDATEPVRVGAASVSPRDVVAACLPRTGHPGGPDERPDLRGYLGDGDVQGRRAAGGVPPPCGRQRLVDGGVRISGGGLADRGEPGGGAGADRLGRLVRDGRAGSRGAAAAAVPRAADRVRLAMGVRRTRPELTVERSPRDRGRSGLGVDLLEYLGGVGHRLGLEAELLHDFEVAVDFDGLVEVQGAGELLDVDHVGQIGLGEPQDGERAAHGRLRARAERQDLQRHRRVVGHLGQVRQLLPDHLPAAHRAAQRALVHYHPQLRRVRPAQDLLAAGPQLAPPRDLLFRGRRSLPYQRAGVPLGLQQAGDELDLVGPDDRGRRLQAHIRLGPQGQDVRVRVPPAPRVRFLGQVEQRGALLSIGDAVQGQQVGHVACLEPDPAVLDPADLGVRAADRLGGLLGGNAPRFAQPVQLAAEHQALDGRAARTRAEHTGGNVPGRVLGRDHRHPSHRCTLGRGSWPGEPTRREIPRQSPMQSHGREDHNRQIIRYISLFGSDRLHRPTLDRRVPQSARGSAWGSACGSARLAGSALSAASPSGVPPRAAA